MIDIVGTSAIINEVEESKNLLEILNYNYFIELGAKLNNKNYDELIKLDKYDYIDYLNEKNKYETLLNVTIDKLNNIIDDYNNYVNNLVKAVK